MLPEFAKSRNVRLSGVAPSESQQHLRRYVQGPGSLRLGQAFSKGGQKGRMYVVKEGEVDIVFDGFQFGTVLADASLANSA